MFPCFRHLSENEILKQRRSDTSFTALTWVSGKGVIDIVKYLVENGADINAKNENDKTALMYASEKGHLEMENILLRKVLMLMIVIEGPTMTLQLCFQVLNI